MIPAVTEEDGKTEGKDGGLQAHKEKLNQTLWEGPGNMISCQLVARGICITHG